MMKRKKRNRRGFPEPVWKDSQDQDDYRNAETFLCLLMRPPYARDKIKHAKATLPEEYRANDLLRASGLPLLPATDPHVARDINRIGRQESLMPLIIVRAQPTIIADGYHRLCAVIHTDPNATVLCQVGE